MTPSPERPRVFISHTDRTPEDQAFTDQVIRRFKKAGIPYWVDREHALPPAQPKPRLTGPAPGNPLFLHLCEAIAGCDVLLFVISEMSVSRQFVRLEFDPRVLFGPAGHILRAKAAVLVLLSNPGTSEMVVVLGGLCGAGNVIDLEGRPFSHFWKRFERLYGQARVLSKDDSWRRFSTFTERPAHKRPTASEKRRSAGQGHRFFRAALASVAEGDLGHAEESLADAYQAYLQARDFPSIARVLHQTFTVSLQIGIQLLSEDRGAVAFGGIVARDTYKMALESIASALENLRGSIEYYTKAKDRRSALAMATLLIRTESRLREAGIDNAREAVASVQRAQVRSIARMLSGANRDSSSTSLR